MKDVHSIDPDPSIILPDEEMLELVMSHYESSKAFIEKFHDRWLMWGNMYRCMVRVPDYNIATYLHVPLTFSTIESFLPRLVGNRPRIDVSARTDEDQGTAMAHRRMIEYQWEHANAQVFLTEIAKSSLTYGTGWGKIGWEVRFRNRTTKEMVTDPDSGITTTTIVKRPLKIYDGPVFDSVSLGDIYPDPSGRNPETCQWVGHKFVMHMHELEAAAAPLEEGGRNYGKEAVAKLKEMRMQSFNEERDQSFKAKYRREHDTQAAKPDPTAWKFEIFEHWEDDRLAVVCIEPRVLLFNDINPYSHGMKPFVRMTDYDIPGELLGLGEAEVLNSIQLELDELHNLRLEQVKRGLMPMNKIRLGSPVNPNFAWQQDGVIFVEEPDDLTPHYVPDVKGSSYRDEDMLRLWAMETTGANDVFKGMQTDMGNETATGASILAQAASSRVALKYNNMVNQVIIPMARQMIALNEQFITDERWIEVVGPVGMERMRITPEMLALGEMDLDVKVDVGESDPVGKQVKIDRLNQILATISQIHQDPNHPAVQVLVKRLYELADIPISDMELQQPAMPPDAMGQGQAPPGTGGLQDIAQLMNVAGTPPGVEAS